MKILLILYPFVAMSGILDNLNRFERATDCTFTISSGNRTIGHNISVGGTKLSYHTQNDKALDVIKNCNTSYSDLGKIAPKYFNGVIVYRDHLHLDLRPNKLFLIK